MKTAVIRRRVADFLKQHPPFDAMTESDLLALSGSGRVKFHESEEYIYQRGDRPSPMLLVIQQGRVDLLDENDRLRDVLGAGDLVGSDTRYSARTASDVIVYALDRALFTRLVEGGGAAGAGRESWLDMPAPVEVRSAVRAMLTGGDISAADELALFCDHNPVALRLRIRGARNAQELGGLLGCARRYVVDALGDPEDVDDAALMGDVFTRAAVEAASRIAREELAKAGLEAPECRHCWLAFGQAARREVLSPALPHLALLYDDADDYAAVWFAALSGQTIGCLDEAGLRGPGLKWPEGASPSMPLSEWKRFYTEAASDPIRCGLYERRGFFDVVVIAGEDSGELRLHIAETLVTHPFALELLANDTLSHLPPLTLFGGLVLQMDGAQSERLDLRKTMIDPVADAARVFELASGGGHEGTLERLMHAGSDAVFVEAAAAFRAALYFEALAGRPDVDVRELERGDQRVLKEAFAAVQRLLELTIARFTA